ncbi:DUF805 domain-containing protein [Chitinivorax sp. B]|uniref:DUF805 domain-containing protein n=1 Tax=Chitinivorax sp. B TaxID=2502235 RepID=UPI0010FA1B6F|nr:DUF805 domain-containing protein [Chitinivorax sp. B]
MSESIDLALTGSVLPGHDVERAHVALAQLLKITEVRAIALLQGQETIIKRGLNKLQLPQYQTALARIGIGTRVIEPTPPANLIANTHLEKPMLTLIGGDGHASGPDEMITCPACGAEQTRRTECRGCGADIEKARAVLAQKARMAKLGEVTAWRPPSANLLKEAPLEYRMTPPFFSFSMEGRYGRARFLAYQLAMYSLMMAGLVISMLLGFGVLGVTAMISVLLATSVMSIRLTVLRLHDIDRTGKWALLLFLPPLSFFLFVFLIVVPGTEGDNDYGMEDEHPSIVVKLCGGICGILFLLGCVGMMLVR